MLGFTGIPLHVKIESFLSMGTKGVSTVQDTYNRLVPGKQKVSSRVQAIASIRPVMLTTKVRIDTPNENCETRFETSPRASGTHFLRISVHLLVENRAIPLPGHTGRY